MPWIHLNVTRNLAKRFKVGDRVRAVVIGEIVEVAADQPIGEGSYGDELQRDVPGGFLVMDVSGTKVRKRSEDEQEELFTQLGLDEDEEDD